jgi:CheY-like chemotaxis protein
MYKRILWLDNDPAYLDPFIDTLKDEGYEVDIASTVSEAEYFLKVRQYELLILDVMIPTVSADEEKRYTPDMTNLGLKTGVVFYIINKELLQKARMQVLVMTVRLDKDIRDEFVNAGLPQNCFATKYELRDASVFLDRIKEMI